MKRKTTEHLGKKLLSVILALAVCVSFVPAFGAVAYADEETPDSVLGNEVVDTQEIDGQGIDGQEVDEQDVNEDGNIEINLDGKDVEIPTDGTEVELDAEDLDTVVDAETGEPQEPAEELEEIKLSEETNDAEIEESNELCLNLLGAQETVPDIDLYSFTVKRSGSYLIINAYFKNHSFWSDNGVKKEDFRFSGIYVDGKQVSKVYGAKLTNYKVKLSSVGGPGYHSVTTKTYHDPSGTFIADSYARSYRAGITKAPTAKGGLATYHNYIHYRSPVDYNLVNYKLFMDYSVNGKTWKTFGPMTYIQDYALKGLKPNTNYKLRTYYGIYKNGSWFTGKEEGKTRYLGTYRTGVGTKVAVKSIKVKAYKVKKKKEKVYGYYTGLYIGKRTKYTYKLKIIVKLKKKPGTNYIWINGKKFKGNKKKYTVKLGKFTRYYSKPKGKKYVVNIHTTYYNSVSGGCSPLYSVKKKIK